MKKTVSKIISYLNLGKDFPLLFIRLALAYGFYTTGKMKWNDISAVADWFGTLGIPAPTLNAYLAASTEIVGVILLVLGLGIRFISFPLVVIMLVAIKTVHWENGFDAGNNGYEIPLYYLIMLLLLITQGGGRLSLDYLIERYTNKGTKPIQQMA